MHIYCFTLFSVAPVIKIVLYKHLYYCYFSNFSTKLDHLKYVFKYFITQKVVNKTDLFCMFCKKYISNIQMFRCYVWLFIFLQKIILFLNTYICPFYEPINCWIIYHISVFQKLQCPSSQCTSRWRTESMWSSCVRLEEGLLRALSSCQWTMNRTTPWRTQHALHMQCVCLTSLLDLLFL